MSVVAFEPSLPELYDRSHSIFQFSWIHLVACYYTYTVL